MSELKPCPFCGGGELLIVGCEYDPDLISVECQHYDCGFTKNGKTTKELAIASWNTRTPNTEALAYIGDIEFMGQTFTVRRENHEAFKAVVKALGGGEGV